MRSLLFFVGSVVVVALSGCRAHGGASFQGPGVNAKRAGNLLASASAELQCPVDQLQGSFVESVEKNAHIYRVVGCEKTYESVLFCFMGNCSWNETPEKRAAFDLQCPREQLTRTYLGRGTFGMAGCGKTITYLFVDGRLVANSATTATPAAQPAP